SPSTDAPADAGFSLRCAYDDTMLYMAVDVSDDRLIRSRSPRPTDDHLVLEIGGGKWEIFPGSAAASAKLYVGGPKGMAVVDSLQKHGWSVELAVARAKIPGVRKGDPAVRFGLAFFDADVAAPPKIETVVALRDASLVFEEADHLLADFLAQMKLRRSDIVLDTTANIDGAPGAERVVWAGRTIGILGEGFAYLELPVSLREDVLEVRAIDLAGEGKASLLVRYVERGNGGAREVLAVWNMVTGSFVRTFAHEVAKVVGRARMTNAWELVAKKRGRGRDLIIRAGDAGGFSKDSWNEAPAEDMMPILLPWGGK